MCAGPAPWLETNLSAAARRGRLEPAYDVESSLMSITESLRAGQFPIVVGEPGVGKTAIIHELVRRAAGADSVFGSRRVLQISFQRRFASLQHRHEIHGEFRKLVDALRKVRNAPVLFIRDIEAAYRSNLEDELTSLAFATQSLIIAEGSVDGVNALLEYESALQQKFTVVRLTEPGLDKTRSILCQWARHQARSTGQRYAPDAVEQAISLNYRFASRRRFPRAAIELLRQSIGQGGRSRAVRGIDVIRRFSARHDVPRALVDPSAPINLDRLRDALNRRVIGQPEAVSAVVDVVSVLKAGLCDLNRPLAALLLVGPSGVGKTYIAQLLAEVLFGHRDRMIRINLTDFAGADDALRLFGTPDDREESNRRGALAARLASQPFGVVLFDEFEKTHESVHDRFMQLIDEGAFVNGEGETISLRSMILIATSNAGYEGGRRTSFGFDADRHRCETIGLERFFRLELLNRFDRIVRFERLGRDVSRRIVVAELRRLQQRTGIRYRNLTITVESSVVNWLADRGYQPEYGARHMRRVISEHVTTAIARVLATSDPPHGSRLRLSLRDDCVVARIERRSDAPVQIVASRRTVQPHRGDRRASRVRPKSADRRLDALNR